MDTKVNLQKPIVTTSLDAYTTASAAKTTITGPQGFRESLIRCTNSPALVSLTKTPNPTGIASKSLVINNGFISRSLTPVGTMSSTSPMPVGNLIPVNATSCATSSTLTTSSLVAQAPTVSENGDSSSSASGIADHSILNTELATQVHALTVTSSSKYETAKETEDAAIGQALNTDDGPEAPISRCENPSESTSHSDSLNDKTSENGQELSKDAVEKLASDTCQNHSTESPGAVVSDQGSKITAEPFMPQENSAHQSEETASQPPSVSFNCHSQTEKETPYVQASLQNVMGDSQECKGLNGLDDRHQEQPSCPEFDKSGPIKEANAA